MEILAQILVVIGFIGLMAVLLAAMVIVPLEQDHPIKMGLISRFGLPTKACECGKNIPSSMRKCSQCKRKEFADGIGAIAGLFGMAVGAVLLVGLVRAGFSILQGINLEALSPDPKKTIEKASVDLNTLKSGSERLQRADQLLAAGDKISVDQAAMLTCATLESGLQMLCQRFGIDQQLGVKEGMVELSQRLTDRNVISYEDLKGIKNLVYRVRNPVMHGDFDRFEQADVRDQISFTRAFLTKHRLIRV